jgi:hypothetical protein
LALGWDYAIFGVMFLVLIASAYGFVKAEESGLSKISSRVNFSIVAIVSFTF